MVHQTFAKIQKSGPENPRFLPRLCFSPPCQSFARQLYPGTNGVEAQRYQGNHRRPPELDQRSTKWKIEPNAYFNPYSLAHLPLLLVQGTFRPTDRGRRLRRENLYLRSNVLTETGR